MGALSKTLIAATLLSTASAASAEQVIVSCNITSSTMRNVAVGAILYRIGDNQWVYWDQQKGAWWGDQCDLFHVVDNVGCTFTPSRFELSGSEDGITVNMTINRETGALSAHFELNGERRSATGTCVPGTEPAPPKTKF